MSEYTTLKILKTSYKNLQYIKLDNDLKSLDEVINFLEEKANTRKH